MCFVWNRQLIHVVEVVAAPDTEGLKDFCDVAWIKVVINGRMKALPDFLCIGEPIFSV